MNLLTTALATFLSFLFTGLAMVYARRSGLIDIPGERHIHNQATPRGGGAGLVLAFVLMAVAPIGVQRPDAAYTVILPAFVTLALLGWLDDHRPLRARTRFVVQLLASVFLVWNLPLSGPYGAAWFMVAAVLFDEMRHAKPGEHLPIAAHSGRVTRNPPRPGSTQSGPSGLIAVPSSRKTLSMS